MECGGCVWVWGFFCVWGCGGVRGGGGGVGWGGAPLGPRYSSSGESPCSGVPPPPPPPPPHTHTHFITHPAPYTNDQPQRHWLGLTSAWRVRLSYRPEPCSPGESGFPIGQSPSALESQGFLLARALEPWRVKVSYRPEPFLGGWWCWYHWSNKHHALLHAGLRHNTSASFLLPDCHSLSHCALCVSGR